MKLPNPNGAYVAREKITRYLLNHNHSEGESKAAFFSRFGFDIGNWDILAEALRTHGASNNVVEISQTEWGVEYVVEGELRTPDGRNPNVRAVWIVDRGRYIPRLVTAYPPR